LDVGFGRDGIPVHAIDGPLPLSLGLPTLPKF
jgi:hypothetical protein